MKKQNEKPEVKTQKKERAKRKFFLYVEGQGFLKSDSTGRPTFDDSCAIISYTERRMANFAAKFFTQIGVAESIDIFAKVG